MALQKTGAGKISGHLTDTYTLREVATRKVRKFNTTCIDYQLTAGTTDNDLVRFVLQSQSLETIW